uniref:Uncharacterized protein n=1 Tax=Arundo donax TaxID=35708 RepID=A0A0A9EC06_ARUDO
MICNLFLLQTTKLMSTVHIPNFSEYVLRLTEVGLHRVAHQVERQ